MPRPRKDPRLYLRKRKGRRAVWVILTPTGEISTGCGIDERAKAEQARQQYLAEHYRAPRGIDSPDRLLVAEIVNAYLSEYAPTSPSAKWIGDMAEDVITWWGDKPLSAVNGRNCRAYVAWRCQQPLTTTNKRTASVATARHELSVLRASIHYYAREYGLSFTPIVTLPPAKPPREDYFWTRQQAARRLRAAWRRPETRHIARLIVIGLYSGSRLQSMLRMRWVPSLTAGWVDIDGGLIHRRGTGASETRKKQPPCRIHRRLLPHLRRWRAKDMAMGISHVIAFNGKPIKDPYNSWERVRLAAGDVERDGPHVLRHSSATWYVAKGYDLPEIASFIGMSVATLTKVYWHRSPHFQGNISETAPKKRPRNG